MLELDRTNNGSSLIHNTYTLCRRALYEIKMYPALDEYEIENE